jgi:hypothetical protein
MQDHLTNKQLDNNGLSKWAVFLPAISGFYATFIGKQRSEPYVDPARFPQGLTDMEQLNWLNSQLSLFPYKWSLHSGGHANLDLNKFVSSEEMIRTREPGTVMVGDSGGFQIAKGLWEGDWKANSGCPDAQGKREAVLKWLDGISDYGMGLDIPTWVVRSKHASAKCQITTHQEAVDATRFNNEYFINNRKGIKAGGARFLNVLQGASHTEAEDWYQTMKEYCDPKKYPDRHFDGWGMGGQNMCDVHLILHRLIALKYDGLLQEGVHDWMHFLGTSKLEWAVLLTVIQRNVRRYANPKFTISFDCASPFLATANGQVYYENAFPQMGKWTYKMSAGPDNRNYATDTNGYGTTSMAVGKFDSWQDSPVSHMLKMNDICYYKPGDVNKNGKEAKTSWDSFSYALLMAHNVWMHITAVQEANRRFDAGELPEMMEYSAPSRDKFQDIVESIFAAPTRQASMAIIEKYDRYWMEIVGGRGYIGNKTRNATTVTNDRTKFEIDTDFSKPKLSKTEAKAKKAAKTPTINTAIMESDFVQPVNVKTKAKSIKPPVINTAIFEE